MDTRPGDEICITCVSGASPDFGSVNHLAENLFNKSEEMDPAESLFLAAMAKHHDNINLTIARGDSRVQQFYAGAVVLVTGASGFLGKQLIEKLFRSCKIKKMYLLLRQKKQMTLQERLDHILHDELYEYLHKSQPEFRQRLVTVAGDVTDNRLGLSENDWNVLVEEVNVVFHVAATVNFLEPLKVATLTNVRGTREMLSLARACKNLKAFVHVSTAYAHATPERVKQSVLEQFYPSPIAPDLLIELAEQLDDQKITKITPHLLENWPNTYAFTKAVAEELVRSMAQEHNLPVSIVRPAIVTNAFCEPVGWADRSNVHTSYVGFVVGIGLGGLHAMFARGETNLDLVPVDLVNNTVIAAAPETAARRTRGQTDVKIYTVSRFRAPHQLKEVIDMLKSFDSLVTPRVLWYAYVVLTDNRLAFFLLTWLLHFAPGYIVDGILALSGKKRKVMRLFDKAYKQNKVYGFYLTNDWKFDDSNLVEMSRNFSPADSIIYACDISAINLKEYLVNSTLGTRKYILKDDLQNTKYARKKYFWLGILNVIYLMLYAYALWKVACLFYGISTVTFGVISNFVCK